MVRMDRDKLRYELRKIAKAIKEVDLNKAYELVRILHNEGLE